MLFEASMALRGARSCHGWRFLSREYIFGPLFRHQTGCFVVELTTTDTGTPSRTNFSQLLPFAFAFDIVRTPSAFLALRRMMQPRMASFYTERLYFLKQNERSRC